MLARSFLIESWTSLISDMIRLLTLELLDIEWWKFYSFELEYLWGQPANLDQILYVASLGVKKDCMVFWGRLDQNSGVHGSKKPQLTYNGENGVSTFSRLLLIRSFLYLQVTRICIKAGTSHSFWSYLPLSDESFTLLNLNISEASWPTLIKFNVKHHWGGEKVAYGFGADWIKTLISMATDSPHWLTIGKIMSPPFLGCFWSDPFYTCR